jgi:hypothetical protein
VQGVIEYFCDAGGGAGHFVQLLIEFFQPTPVINNEWSVKLMCFLCIVLQQLTYIELSGNI